MHEFRTGRKRYNTILTCLILLAVIMVGYRFIFAGPAEQMPTKYSNKIPLEIGDWEGVKYSPSKQTCNELKTDDIFDGKYVDGSGRVISLSMAFLSKEMAIHDPERCFVGSGWKEIDKRTESVKLPGSDNEFNMTRVVFEKNRKKRMAMYAYRIGNKLVSNYVYYEVARSLGLRSELNAMVYISAGVVGDMDKTVASMKEFAQELLSVAPEFWKVRG